MEKSLQRRLSRTRQGAGRLRRSDGSPKTLHRSVPTTLRIHAPGPNRLRLALPPKIVSFRTGKTRAFTKRREYFLRRLSNCGRFMVWQSLVADDVRSL